MGIVNITAQIDTWAVLPNRVELIFIESGHQFTTSQEVEFYTDELEARSRAVDLGWTDPDLESIVNEFFN